MKSMKRFDDYLSVQMQNEEFKKEYENMQPDLDITREIVASESLSPSCLTRPLYVTLEEADL